MVPTASVFKNRDLTVVDGIVNFKYNKYDKSIRHK